MSKPAPTPGLHGNESGFSLIWIVFLLLIVSMTAVTFLQKEERDDYWNPRTNTRANFDKITDALVQYQRTGLQAARRLPCPARMSIDQGLATFGVEDCATGATVNDMWVYDAGGTATDARIGMLPVRTLGLPDSEAFDQFGNRILYAVTNNLRTAGVGVDQFATSQGGLTVLNAAGGTVTSVAAYVIVSPGKDQKGGYSAGLGTSIRDCTSSVGLDQANCDHQPTAIGAAAPNGTFRVGDLNTTEGATFFDDTVIWQAVDATAQLP